MVRSFLFQDIHNLALMLDRQAQGRDEQPTAVTIDSQTVKARAKAWRGYDAAKRINSLKRHIVVDTEGRLLLVRMTPAEVADSTGALARLDKGVFLDFVVEVVRGLAGQQGFAPLPRRWIVERTFGWMMCWRRLVRDYEMRLDVSMGMIHIPLGNLLLQRLLIPE